MMSAYHRRLTGSDSATQLEAARCWSRWEMTTSRLIVDKDLLQRVESDTWALQFARIESYVVSSLQSKSIPATNYARNGRRKLKNKLYIGLTVKNWLCGWLRWQNIH